ncbi:MAG: glycosyltransferase, partial [Planctomycetaceae bacterium]
GLADAFRPNWVFAVNPHLSCSISSRKRCFGFNPRWHLLYRLLIPLLERQCDVSHVYSGPSPWPFSSALRRKPIVLTIVEPGEPDVSFLRKCRKIIVQTPEQRSRVLDTGIDAAKVELLFTPVDTTKYHNLQPRVLSDSPTILFATSPRTSEEMEERGVNLMLEAAPNMPQVVWRMLFRRWRCSDTAYETTARLVAERRLSNIQLQHGNVVDMQSEYQAADFTIIPFTRSDGGKPCPNSMAEGFASGLPVLISSVSPMADFVRRNRCGAVFHPTASSFRDAFASACDDYCILSRNSCEVAKTYFCQQTYFKRMAAIYNEVLEPNSTSS